ATPDKGKYAASQFTTVASLLDALDQRNTSLPQLWKESDEELKTQLNRLNGLFDAARALVADKRAPQTEQLLALRLLGRGRDRQQEDVQMLEGLLVPQSTEIVQAAVVESLGRLRDPKVPDVLLRGWKGHSPGRRSQILDVLFRRDDWLKAVLDALEQKKILSFEIDAARQQRLWQHKSADVRSRAAKLFTSLINPDRQKVIDSYRAVLTMKGDPARGLQVFTKHCAACHRLGEVGQSVGPDLAALGDKSPESLLIAILDPNRAVE